MIKKDTIYGGLYLRLKILRPCLGNFFELNVRCSVDGGTEHCVRLDDQVTGILSGHAYSIIDIFEIPKEKKNPLKGHGTHRLLRVRNPWG